MLALGQRKPTYTCSTVIEKLGILHYVKIENKFLMFAARIYFSELVPLAFDITT